LLSELIRRSEVVRIPRWAPHGDECIVAISIELISGRRILAGTPAVVPGIV
jgi:hypothetical protein